MFVVVVVVVTANTTFVSGQKSPMQAPIYLSTVILSDVFSAFCIQFIVGWRRNCVTNPPLTTCNAAF